MNVFGCSRHIHIIHIWGFPLGVPLVIIHFNRIFREIKMVSLWDLVGFNNRMG
jgi:hypothetical protein